MGTNKKAYELQDLATIIRRKNAGVLLLTFDIIFESEDVFKKVNESGVICRNCLLNYTKF